jgi:hypothetical protein
MWAAFNALRPAMIRRMRIRLGGAEKSAALPDVAYGLSRHTLDAWLWDTAIHAAAEAVSDGRPNVITTGRLSETRRGGRLFGFKAHFEGPTDDAVELFFAGSMYVGVNCVERAITNVCGLAAEEQLRRCDFDVDGLIRQNGAIRERLSPLTRKWDWIFTGPLEFRNQLAVAMDAYVAGDALSFVDPFTGSGLLCAILTGSLAGWSAATELPIAEYRKQCAALLKQPFNFSSALRRIAAMRAAGPLLRVAPANLLFRFTRPSIF